MKFITINAGSSSLRLSVFRNAEQSLQLINAGHFPAAEVATGDQFRCLLTNLDAFGRGGYTPNRAWR